jgi:adhesin transport system membrane fusion protein
MNVFQRLLARGDAHRDAAFMADVKAAMQGRASSSTNVGLYVLAAFLGVATYWAATASLDIVTVGQGTVIPSSKVQMIQNLEGGILAELPVREGQTVEKGQVVARISDVRFASDYRDNRARYLSLLARIARLTAEVQGTALAFPQDVRAERPDLIRNETELYLSRRKGLEELIAVLKRSHEMVSRELEMSIPLVAKGAMSEVEILRLRRQVNELDGQVADKRNLFVADAQRDLTATKGDLASMAESIQASKDRMVRTTVRSPMRGMVKKLNIMTIGGVIQPGSNIMEVVPLEDTLLIETHVQPDDIGFVRVGQEANVKITAFDFSIYGGLPGTVEVVSADAIVDDNVKNQTYYKVMVRTRSNHLEWKDGPLLIIPGMTATADILTGKRTVLQYLLKPVLKTTGTALRER